jgi:serine/threonine protein kinase
MPLVPDDRLGPYEILGPLGSGGMGEVYQARDTRLDRIVAIKILKGRHSERFEREARAIAALNHPHICALYDVGPDYLVMEYVEGKPLRGPLPAAEALRYAVQIAKALDAAHRRGIIHRDLKPSNILVTKTGVKLLDFGLAKATRERVATATEVITLTQEGAIAGTPLYMAPEQLEGKEADARSDIWSFGCVLCEMCTGRRAFTGATTASVIGAIMERTLEPLPTNVPQPVERIIRTCLAKDPDDRWQSARDVMLELEWAADAASRPTPGAYPSRIVTRERLLWIAVVVLLLGIDTVLLLRPQSDEGVIRLSIMPPPDTTFDFALTSGGIAISPDGRTLAFVAPHNGRPRLWVRPLDATDAQPLAGTEDASLPFWSPDSRSIAFFTRSGLGRVDLATGCVQQLVSRTMSMVGSGGTWSSRGEILFSSLSTRVIQQVSVSGSQPASVTAIDASRGEFIHEWPVMLPDGRHFVFLIGSAKPGNTGLYLGSLDTKPEAQGRTRILQIDSGVVYAPPWHDWPGFLLFVRNQTLMAIPFDAAHFRVGRDPFEVSGQMISTTALGLSSFSVSANGALVLGGELPMRMQPQWVDRRGKRLDAIGTPDVYDSLRLSPDATRAALKRDDLWLLEMGRGVTSRFTFENLVAVSPVWSPDGRRIVFSGIGHGHQFNLYMKDASGTGPERRITNSPNIQVPTDWSRDGKYILLYELTSDHARDLMLLKVSTEPLGEPRPSLLLQTTFDEWQGRFSPEAGGPHWFAYTSNESGRDEVYVRGFPNPGEKCQVSTQGGSEPSWRSDGKEIFYRSADGQVMAVKVTAGGSRFTPSGPEPLFRLNALPQNASSVLLDPAPDGQRFFVLVPAAMSEVKPMTVIVNWQKALKKPA